MPRAPKRRRYMLEDLDSASEAQALLGAQVPEAKEEEAATFPSYNSSSSPSSPSSSSCCFCLNCCCSCCFCSSPSSSSLSSIFSFSFSSSSSPSSSPSSFSPSSFSFSPSSFSSPSFSPSSFSFSPSSFSPSSFSPSSSPSSFFSLSSFSPSSFSSSSSSFSSSCCCLAASYIKALSAVAETLRPLQVPQSACFPPNVTAVTPSTQLCQGCSSPEEKGSGTSQAVPDTGLSLRDAIDSMVATLVRFLLLKYRARELTTKAEMLSSITKQHQDHFPEIFSKASECLQLVLGIDMKEVDSINHSYVLVNTLGLSYNGTLSDEHSMPKAGLLISVLGVIFIHGNCVSEEDLWEALSDMGVYPEREHFIYGEPRNLITKVWVQEQYLEYRQIPNSVPARYEFLWGLRAHAETSKMKILELLAKVNNTIPEAFPILYEEVLKDEEEIASQGCCQGQ